MGDRTHRSFRCHHVGELNDARIQVKYYPHIDHTAGTSVYAGPKRVFQPIISLRIRLDLPSSVLSSNARSDHWSISRCGRAPRGFRQIAPVQPKNTSSGCCNVSLDWLYTGYTGYNGSCCWYPLQREGVARLSKSSGASSTKGSSGHATTERGIKYPLTSRSACPISRVDQAVLIIDQNAACPTETTAE